MLSRGDRALRIAIGDPSPDWLLCNELLRAADHVWEWMAGFRCADAVFLNYILSKMSEPEARRLVRNAAELLKVGGHLRIADIDGSHPKQAYLEHVSKFGPQSRPNIGSVATLLLEHGFRVTAGEFYDRHGQFHQRSIDAGRGLVIRSRTLDPRGNDPDLLMSSLIVDGELVHDDRRYWMSAADVAAVYRAILDRDDVTTAELERAELRHQTSAALAAELFSTMEFQNTLVRPLDIRQLDPKELATVYAAFRVGRAKGTPGFYTGGLGDRIDVRFAEHLLRNGSSGKAATSIPVDAEYYSILYSVAKASPQGYAMVELGAGFGPWLVRAAQAARQQGIHTIRLGGVEADRSHFRFLSEHFRNNDLNPAEHSLFCGVVGATDGIAYFPEITDPSVDWGARAISADTMRKLAAAGRTTDRLGQAYREVEAYSIGRAISSFDRIDLLHIDIQGHELQAINASIADLNAKVKLMYIGTHSVEIDAALIRLMAANGWVPLHIWPKSVMRAVDRRSVGGADGEQIWLNSRLSSEA